MPAPRRPVEATAPAEVWPPPTGRSRVQRVEILVVATVVVVIGLLAVALIVRSLVGPTAAVAPTPPTPAAVASTLGVVSARGSCPVTSGTDAAGTRFTYGGENAVDGDEGTAWRCRGTGVGESLTLDLGTRRVVTALALLPGFDKVDPYDGTDRWLQSPRVATARWTFDDGSSVVRSYATGGDASSRRLQTVDVVPTTTRTVTITILSVAPGLAVGSAGPAGLSGFSETAVLGR